MPIIISSDVRLNPSVDDEPLTHARIGWQSLARDVANDDILTSGTADGFTALAPKNGLTYEYWQSPANPAHWGFDYGSAVEANYAGIAGHTIGTNNLTVKVQASDDGVSWDDASSDFIPADDRPIMFLFEAQSRRYWRVHVDGAGDPASIAVIYIGKVLQMPRPIYGGHTPITLSRDTIMNPNMSDGGQFLGRSIRRTGVSTDASWRHLDPNWYRENFDPFVKSARRYPFFFAWRPEDWPTEVGYCWSNEDIRPSNMGTREWMEVGISMTGLADYE